MPLLDTSKDSGYTFARRHADAAIAKRSRALVYEALGIAKGLRDSGRLSALEYRIITDLLVRDTIAAKRWKLFR